MPLNKLLFLLVLFLSACSHHSEYQQLQAKPPLHRLDPYLQNDIVNNQPIINKPVITGDFQARQQQQSLQLQQAVRQNHLLPLSLAQWQKFSDLSQSQTLAYLKKHPDVNTILGLVLVKNPDIKSAYQRLQAELKQYKQIQQLDDLLQQYQSFTQNLNLHTSNQKGLKAKKASTIPNSLALKGEIVEKSIQQAAIALEQTIQTVLTKTRVTYFEWHYFNQAHAIVAENVALLERLSEVTEQVYNTTKASLDTVLVLQNDTASSKNRLQTMNAQAQVRWLRLSQLLNLDYQLPFSSHSITMKHRLTADKNAGIKTGLTQATAIQAVKLRLDKMALLIQLAETKIYPDFSLNPSGFKPAFNASKKPKNNTKFLSNQAYLLEMKQRHQALLSSLDNVKNNTIDAINVAYFNYDDSHRQYNLYQQTLIPNTKSQFEIQQSLYETGQSSYSNMIKAYKIYLDARLTQATLQRDWHIAASRLERLIGDSIVIWTTKK